MLYTCSNPERKQAQAQRMASSQDEDFVDRVAQAVIDKIEERDRVAGLVEEIALRVIAIQKHEAALQKAAAQPQAGSGNIGNSDEPAGKAEE